MRLSISKAQPTTLSTAHLAPHSADASCHKHCRKPSNDQEFMSSPTPCPNQHENEDHNEDNYYVNDDIDDMLLSMAKVLHKPKSAPPSKAVLTHPTCMQPDVNNVNS